MAWASDMKTEDLLTELAGLNARIDAFDLKRQTMKTFATADHQAKACMSATKN